MDDYYFAAVNGTIDNPKLQLYAEGWRAFNLSPGWDILSLQIILRGILQILKHVNPSCGGVPFNYDLDIATVTPGNHPSGESRLSPNPMLLG
jgi:hypothetical protein